MIIVYGTRSGSSETRLNTPCSNCRQPALTQFDGYQYLHIMFVPTFPLGKQRSVHCGACGNSYDTKGSAPIWTFAGSVILAVLVLGGGGFEALRRMGHAAHASISSATSESASAPAVASAPPTPKAAAAPAATTQPVAASADAGAPVAAKAAKGKTKTKKK